MKKSQVTAGAVGLVAAVALQSGGIPRARLQLEQQTGQGGISMGQGGISMGQGGISMGQGQGHEDRRELGTSSPPRW